MLLSELRSHINRVTDEDFSIEDITHFINDGIAAINVECRSNFPFLSSETDEEPAIPESWQRMLLVPYAAARVKQNDSSQFEYNDWLLQFENALVKFKSTYKIPSEYKEEGSGPFLQDFQNDYYRWG